MTRHGIKSIGDLRNFLQFFGYYLKYPLHLMHYSYDSNYSQHSSEVWNRLYGLSSKQMNMSNKASENYW